MYKFVSIVAAAVLLGGCGTEVASPSPTPTVTVTATQAPSPAPEDTTDDTFIAVLESQFGPMDAETEMTSKSVARKICTLLDMDTSVVTIVNIVKSAGFTDYDAGYFIGASVKAYCPEFIDTIKAQAL